MNELTLYTKPGCHLCEAVEQAIAQVRRRREFSLLVRNILDDPADFEKYEYEIPVVLLNGREIARHRMSPAELDTALQMAGSFGDVAVVVMTKYPHPGKVKTRLCPPLTPDQAADVHRVFLRHLCRRLEALQPDELVVCHDPPESGAALRELLRSVCSAKFIAQSPGDLGERIAGAARAVGQNHRRILFLGVDSPDIATSHLLAAAAMTGQASVTLGACADGGFWCLGLWNEVDAGAMLANISWSSGREARQVADHARAMSYAVASAPAWRDVDRPDDLRELLSRVSASGDADDQRLRSELAAVVPAEVLEPTK